MHHILEMCELHIHVLIMCVFVYHAIHVVVSLVKSSVEIITCYVFTFSFHGLIAQAEAAEVLLGHQDGSFLVRETSSGKHILSLM